MIPALLFAALLQAPASGIATGGQPPGAVIAPDSYAVNATSAFVRRTPTLPGPVIWEVKGHTLFKVVGCADGWCKLDLGWRAGVGYLPQGELIPVPAPASFSPRSPS